MLTQNCKKRPFKDFLIPLILNRLINVSFQRNAYVDAMEVEQTHEKEFSKQVALDEGTFFHLLFLFHLIIIFEAK